MTSGYDQVFIHRALRRYFVLDGYSSFASLRLDGARTRTFSTNPVYSIDATRGITGSRSMQLLTKEVCTAIRRSAESTEICADTLEIRHVFRLQIYFDTDTFMVMAVSLENVNLTLSRRQLEELCVGPTKAIETLVATMIACPAILPYVRPCTPSCRSRSEDGVPMSCACSQP